MTHPFLRSLRRLARPALPALLLALTPLAGCTKGVPPSVDTNAEFAGRMAQMGNWREAVYRWERALDETRNKARIYNNMAVAYERLGDWEKAAEAYERALEEGGESIRQIRDNYEQFLRFYREHREREVIDQDGDSGDA
jgi:tetratricopeptide (TPR) repeat protein